MRWPAGVFLVIFCLPFSVWTQEGVDGKEGESGGDSFVPEAARVLLGEGNEAFARGEYGRAREAYGRFLELVPDSFLGLVNLGLAEFADGQKEAAEKTLKRALQMRMETASAWLALGKLYLDEGRLDESLAALAQVLVLDPGNARARNFFGVVVGRKGWVDGAQSELRRAVEIDPNYSDAHYNLAYFYLAAKPPLVELARRHYFRSLELGAQRDPEMEARLKRRSITD